MRDALPFNPLPRCAEVCIWSVLENLERPVGIEPTLKRWQRIGLPISDGRLKLERARRLELPQSTWKDEMLPLHHTRSKIT